MKLSQPISRTRGLARPAAVLGALALLLLPAPGGADYVGSLVNRIFVDPASIPVIADGVQNGDVISYVLETTPADTGSVFGHAAWMTLYLPAGAEVVNAEFVRPSGNGGYDVIPAEDTDETYDGWGSRGAAGYTPSPPLDEGFVNEVQQDTGIFYSSDPRTAVVVGGFGVLDPTGVSAQTIYNEWDFDQTEAFGIGGALSGNGGGGNTPVVTTDGGSTWIGVGSIVAGPDTYYTNDYNPACDGVSTNFEDDVLCVGPWQRIAYPNSKIGAAGAIAPATAQGAIQNTSVPTSAGFVFDGVVALPGATNAVRWVHGRRRLGEIETGRITLRVTDASLFPNSLSDDTFCLDSTGGDTSNTAAKDNPFRYYEPQHACNFLASSANFFKQIRYVNGNLGSGTALAVGDVIGYEISFTNTAGETLTDIMLSDTSDTADLDLLEPGNALCPFATYDGDIPGPTYNSGSATAGTATWDTIASLASGETVTVTLCAEVVGGNFGERLDNTADVTYTASTGTISLSSTAGGTVSSRITGTVYIDADSSGDLTAGDAGTGGVTVELYVDNDGDGTLSAGDTFVDAVTTLSDGSYVFAGIPGDDYVVVETDPAGWTSTGDADSPGGTCGVGNGCNTIGTIALANGGSSDGNDFFDAAPASAVNTITGTVYEDVDQDGVLDAGETGAAGTSVELWRDNNGDGLVGVGDTLLQTVATAADGSYQFTLTEEGDFVVQTDTSTLPLGSSLTTDNVETASFVGFGNSDANNDFGYFGGLGSTGGVCFAVADGDEQLVAFDITNDTFTDIGDTGVLEIEAIAYDVGSDTLYAADAGTFGTLDIATGAFTAIGAFGSCTLPDLTVITISDVDGLALDPLTRTLWGVERNGAADTLFTIDLATGAAAANCVSITGVDIGVLVGDDIDDIGFDPTTNTLYGVATGDGLAEGLFTIDSTTGVATLVGLLAVTDFEGLGFANDGTLYGTTGDSGTNPDELFTIDKTDATATPVFAFPLYSDYESVDCMTSGANAIEGTTFVDFDGDGLYEPGTGESGQGGITVNLYLDNNNDGTVDVGDTLIQTTVTATDGSYDFFLGVEGNFVIETDLGTYPAGATFTTDNVEEADFVGFNNLDSGNDFGFQATSELTIVKSSDAAGDVLPGDTITYTIVVTNTSTTRQTDVTLFDLVPTGTTYVAESTSATGPVPGPVVLAASDDFETDDYTGGSGWADDWMEIDDNGNPGNGDVQVRGDGGDFAVRIDKEDSGLFREADLSAYATATLELEFRRDNFNSADDETAIEVSGDGGMSWNTLEVIIGPDNDATYQTRSYDITNEIATNTQIRFVNSSTNDKRLYFDEVMIFAQTLAVETKTNEAAATNPLTDGVPSDLVEAADLFQLEQSDTLTVTYQVLVDGPLDENVTQIFNEAIADSAEALPVAAQVADPVSPGAIIGDRVWIDTDSDGIQDIGESGIANVTVRLYLDPDGVPGNGDEVEVGSTDTDASGNYLFDHVYPAAAGSYYTEVDATTLPGGLAPTAGNNAGRSASVSPVGEDSFLDLDFGYTLTDPTTALIGDFVWSDADGDGVQDPGEPGIAGVPVELLSAGVDGVLGTADDVVEATTTTGADGSYYFTGVAPGEYLVRVDETDADLTGYTATVGPQSEGSDTSAPITVIAGDIFTDADFGYNNPALFSITDRAWSDADGDGTQDVGESGIAGVTVNLLDSAGNIVATAITDSNGDFSFDGLEDGDYTIEITDTTGKVAGLSGTTAAAQADLLAVTVAGADVTGVNFGYNAPGSLGDELWSDADGDGVRDPGEAGLSGVTVELWLDDGDGIFDSTVDTLVDTTVTDGSGGYLFDGLTPGTYFASVDDAQAALAGYTPTTTDEEPGANAAGTQIEATVTATGSFLDADFGYQNTALPDISGNVFNDLDLDGVDDGAGEPGLAGVTLDLLDAAGNVVATAVTDAAGDYSFPDLEAGDYTVAVTDVDGVLDGYRLTSGLDAREVTVAAADITGIDFGYARGDSTGSIGETVWHDLDRDGIEDNSEPGLSGVTVELYEDSDGDGVRSAGDTLIDTTVTDANGQYIFDGLPAGNYFADVVDATVPAGLALTGGSDPSALVNLSAGEAYREADFGYAGLPGTQSIGDTVFGDTDLDGIQQPGEPGIDGITVNLLDDMGNTIATTTTGPDGRYLFTGLAPAFYTVEVVAAGVSPDYGTTPTNGDVSRTYDLTAGVDMMHADFGFPPAAATASIGDTIFLDLDGDGVQDAAEDGIAGVTVNLVDIGGNIVATTTSDANGNYDFTSLPAGTYTVDVTDVDGIVGGLNLSAGSDPTAPIVLLAGQDYNDADFPYAPSAGTGSIGDVVFHDINGDGTQDPGESGFAGVTLDLWLDTNNDGVITPGVDNLVRTETTDENGEYEFNTLPFGDYLVTVTDKSGVLDINGNGVIDGDEWTQTAGTEPTDVTLTAANPNEFFADFGYQSVDALAIRGTTFFDVVGDAILNGDDQGVALVTVELYRDLDGDGVLDPGEPLFATTPSVVGGTYEFTDLPAGDYIVSTDPTGTFLAGTRQTTQSGTGGVQPVSLVAADSENNDFGFNLAPTMVLVSDFGAYVDEGRFVVEWKTASQAGSLGFFVYRWDDELADYAAVNAMLLPAAIGAHQGATYRLIDDGASAGGSYQYALVEVEAGGAERFYGPWVVTADWQRGRTAEDRMSDGYEARPHRPSARTEARRSQARRAREERAATRPVDHGGGRSQPADGRLEATLEERDLYFVAKEDLQIYTGPRPLRRVGRGGPVRLTRAGVDVAWLAAEDSSGLYFFGRALDSIYSTKNVYRFDRGAGRLMGSFDGGLPAPVAGGWFSDTSRVEEDLFGATLVTRDPESDYWFWEYVSAGSPSDGSRTFTVPVTDLATASGEAAVELLLFGASETPAANDHHVRVRVNGVEVGDSFWDGTIEHRVALTFPQSLLVEGDNEVEVEGVLDTGAPYSIFYVDSLSLDYSRRFRAAADRLLFRGDGSSVVTVDGFSSSDILVLDVTDPDAPRRVSGTTVDATDSWRVSLVPESPDAVYFAATRASARLPELEVDVPSDLHRADGGAEYVVVAPESLADAAAELAEFRSTRFSTRVALLGDIYDEFNHGLESPHAIREFLAWAHQFWTTTPTHVVLLGKGTFDYQDRYGLGDNLVPPLMASTPYGLYATDARLADLVGDDRSPELAIGRIPVLSAAEVTDYIDKLALFESGATSRRVVLLADDADGSGDFPSESDALVPLLPEGTEIDRIYLSEEAVETARERLFTALSEGAEVVNYLGHGGLDRLAGEGLVLSSDAADFAAGARPPLVTALTCSVGRFEVPGFSSLGEVLVIEPGAGAVAVWSPSGLSLDFEAVGLDTVFLQNLYNGDGVTVGEAIRRALESHSAEVSFPFMLDIYNLLGDPGVLLD